MYIYNMKNSIVILSCFLLLSSCANNKSEVILANTICDTSNTKFGAVVNPIITTNCVSGCHGGSSPSGGVDLSTYNNIADFASNCATRMKSSSNPMPPSGKLSDCEIKKFDKWIANGKQNN